MFIWMKIFYHGLYALAMVKSGVRCIGGGRVKTLPYILGREGIGERNIRKRLLRRGRNLLGEAVIYLMSYTERTRRPVGSPLRMRTRT